MTRIVSGRFGGLRLQTPHGTSTRPTSERVREALFSALDHSGVLDGARVLDLYAGSGALGLEALSRGASAVTLVDSSAAAITVIRDNARSVARAAGADTARPAVIKSDADSFARRTDESFDVVLIDPPYAVGEAALTRTLRAVTGIIGPTATVIVERATRSPEPAWPDGLAGVRSKKYGDTTLWWAEPAAAAPEPTAAEPASDGDVAEFAGRLGIPGLFDVHTHFMPQNVLDKVWRFFERNERFDWPITYRQDEDTRKEQLAALGVRRYTAMLYPHRAGMAEWLNGWGAEFAARSPNCLHTATFYPEPGNAEYVADALASGARIFKSHVQVGDYDPRDTLLDDVWGTLEDAGVPTVIHCGTGPNGGRFTGPDPIRDVLARFPRLPLIIAHMGMPEYDDFLQMAVDYERVYVDTTMVFTDFIEALMPFPPRLRSRLAELQGKILLGTDFPNVPYPYAHQIAALNALGLGDDWMRDVLWRNAERLLP